MVIAFNGEIHIEKYTTFKIVMYVIFSILAGLAIYSFQQ